MRQYHWHSKVPIFKAAFTIFLFCALFCKCTKSPVLYPNDHFLAVGKDQADTDIRICIELAEQRGVSSDQNRKVAKSTAMGAGAGAAGGAVGGAIGGNVGAGAATGAASGAAVGLFSGILGAGDPSPAYKAFVNKCLSEKGYEPIGWE